LALYGFCSLRLPRLQLLIGTDLYRWIAGSGSALDIFFKTFLLLLRQPPSRSTRLGEFSSVGRFFFLLWAFLFKTFYFVSSRFNSWVLLLLTHLEICHVLFMNWTIGKL
jgi:hypothetical protein